MTLLFSILIILSAVLLVLAVLAQNSKGNGLSNSLGGASQLMGVKRTTDIIEKLTWGFAIGLLTFCLCINLFVEKPEANAEGSGSVNIDRAKASKAKQAPASDTQQPQDTTASTAPDSSGL
ncbi:MAG TPA: preprotein translocase subunit SecG [Cytophagaceae bacterium]|jgi:preprotein translocase subunit SecG|nr:preprotein translocase subunit SecG [Cytophagaceae bacterium]